MRSFPIVGVVLALAATLAVAQVVVAPDDAGKILLRASSYDRNLAARTGKSLLIAVVSRAGDVAAAADAMEMAGAFRRAGATPSGGLPVTVEVWSIIKPSELTAKLSSAQVGMLYVAAGFEPAELRKVAEAAHAGKVLCTYRSPSYEKELALGVLRVDDKARLVVNLAAAQREGVDFDSQLLRLAVVK